MGGFPVSPPCRGPRAVCQGTVTEPLWTGRLFPGVERRAILLGQEGRGCAQQRLVRSLLPRWPQRLGLQGAGARETALLASPVEHS